MTEEAEDDILVIDDNDVEMTELSENDDYLVVGDPTSDKDTDWCVLFVKGDYKDMVVKYDDVGLDTKTGQLGYTYSILSTGDGEEKEINELDFTNYLTSALHNIMIDMHKSGAAAYVDLKTKEEISY